VFERTSENLTTLFSNSNISQALDQISSNWSDYGQLIIGMEDAPLDAREGMDPRFITSGFAGINEAFEKMLYGVEGQDLKYPGLEVLLERMSEAIANNDYYAAFNEINVWTLYGLEDMGKALAPVLSIPAREMMNMSSLFNEFIGPLDTWAFIKDTSATMMEPAIGVFYQLSETLTKVFSGDMDALLSAPAQLINTLVNGYEVPGTDNVFVGLLNEGSIFDLLMVHWPARVAEALSVGTADLPTNAGDLAELGVAGPDLLGTDFLANLFDGSFWDTFAL